MSYHFGFGLAQLFGVMLLVSVLTALAIPHLLAAHGNDAPAAAGKNVNRASFEISGSRAPVTASHPF